MAGRLCPSGSRTTASGRPLQSLAQDDVLLMKKPRVIGKRKIGPCNADDSQELPMEPEPASIKSGPHALRSILVNVSLKKELIDGRLAYERHWLEDAQAYLFFAPFDSLGAASQYDALWFTGKQIHHKRFQSKKQLENTANSLGRRVLAEKSTPAAGLSDPIIIEPTIIRLMPPDNGGGKSGWAMSLGVSVYPELMCYSASKIENWQKAVEKGIVLRRVANAEPADLERAARMCMDTSVRLSETTVIPAPFKMLREIQEITIYR